MRKFRARALLCFSLSCPVLVGATSSFAAPAGRPADDETTVAIARERFKEGVAFFDQKQYDKARVAFLQAYALKKHPAVLLNLAQSELRSNHEVDAAKHFSAYLRESTSASEAERQAAEAGLSATKSVVALLDVSVDEGGAEIYVDGSLEGVSPLPGALYVSPGPHSVEARKGGRTRTQSINTSAGRQFMAELNFAAKPAPTEAAAAASAGTAASEPGTNEPVSQVADHPEPSAGRKPFFKWLVTSPVGLVGVSLTGIGLGSGVGLAIASNKSYANADSVADQITSHAALDSMMANPDTNGLCADPSAWLSMTPSFPKNEIPARATQYSNACAKYQDTVSTGDSLKTWATVGFVVGGAAAVGTVIAYFVDPHAREGSNSEARSERRRVSVVPSIGPAQTSLTVMGSF